MKYYLGRYNISRYLVLTKFANFIGGFQHNHTLPICLNNKQQNGLDYFQPPPKGLPSKLKYLSNSIHTHQCHRKPQDLLEGPPKPGRSTSDDR